MKNILLPILLTIAASPGYGQPKADTGIKMSTDYGSENIETQDLLNFQKIDYYKVKLYGHDVKGKNYYVVIKEMWNGKIANIDTLINTATTDRIKPIETDSLHFRVTAEKSGDHKLRLLFRFPGFSIDRTYCATNSEDYSLRDVGAALPIEPNKEFAAFAYILPYEKNGYKMWCEVENSGKEIQNWGNEFNLEHYLIVEMKFE